VCDELESILRLMGTYEQFRDGSERIQSTSKVKSPLSSTCTSTYTSGLYWSLCLARVPLLLSFIAHDTYAQRYMAARVQSASSNPSPPSSLRAIRGSCSTDRLSQTSKHSELERFFPFLIVS